MLRRIINFVVEDWIGTAAMAVILVVMATQILLRKFAGENLIWSDELSRYLLIGMVFLGTATASRKGEHIRIDLVDHILPERARIVLARAVDVLVIAYLVFIAWQSLGILAIYRTQPSSAMGVPMAVPYATITVGFTLAALRMVLRLAFMRPER
jgi:TRAP-type C4-dicarboxylate transport system permease small subunit